MKLQTIKMALSRSTGRGGLLLKKHSPEVLMTVGVVGIVASTVMACRATLKSEKVIAEAKEKIENIKYAKKIFEEEKYSEQDYKKDLTVTYIQTSVDFVKLYGPAVVFGMASVACILGSHNIMKKRNLALVAAYKAVEKSFTDYRNRVVEELGVDKDRMFKNGIKQTKVSVLEVDENGNSTESEKVFESVDPDGISQYARFFDESCSEWSKTPEYNLTFLKCQERFANDLLNSRGHIFLNEVYDMLGIPRTQAGAVVGWVKGEGDEFVDFGIFNGDREPVRSFVNGYERSILLDFNVAGVIYDLI